MADELEEFLNSFKDKIGKQSHEVIEKALKENEFSSRLSLKLLSNENLDHLLRNTNLPLGARKVLEFHLDLLREQSPLLKLSKSQSKSCLDVDENPSASYEDTSIPAKRSLENRRRTIEDSIHHNKQDLEEMNVQLESMNLNVPELPMIGNYKVICSNCHHRGHRNTKTKPCILEKCSAFTYCELKDKHPEYSADMNRLKFKIKQKHETIKQLQEELNGVNNFQSQSEHQ
ncbi:uncharacterized protein LOC124439333 [Xenia sp. Carnegie-2017]|uniref:uncharacterized protein LOC124439333 n=1 Tax=Xenia sp. Carnegie-2017 TaxID=2897299 RepID=UPI001F046BC3|nr:uncharacterized protein LOC124439333 [Xenia sp. Carnegie-2017]